MAQWQPAARSFRWPVWADRGGEPLVVLSRYQAAPAASTPAHFAADTAQVVPTTGAPAQIGGVADTLGQHPVARPVI